MNHERRAGHDTRGRMLAVLDLQPVGVRCGLYALLEGQIFLLFGIIATSARLGRYLSGAASAGSDDPQLSRAVAVLSGT